MLRETEWSILYTRSNNRAVRAVVAQASGVFIEIKPKAI